MSVLEQPQAAETLKLMKTATWETGATFKERTMSHLQLGGH